MVVCSARHENRHGKQHRTKTNERDRLPAPFITFLTLTWSCNLFSCAPSTAEITLLYSIPTRDSDGSMSHIALNGVNALFHGSSDRSAGESLRPIPPQESGMPGYPNPDFAKDPGDLGGASSVPIRTIFPSSALVSPARDTFVSPSAAAAAAAGLPLPRDLLLALEAREFRGAGADLTGDTADEAVDNRLPGARRAPALEKTLTLSPCKPSTDADRPKLLPAT